MRVVPRRSRMTLEFVCRGIISVLPPVSESAFLLWPCNPGLVARTTPGHTVDQRNHSRFTLWLSHVWLFAAPWTAACQASLSFTISWRLLKLISIESVIPSNHLKLISIESVMPSNHLILCCSHLLLPSIFSSIRIFSNELAFCIKWPKYWSFSFSMSPSNEYSGLISFKSTGLISLLSKGLSRVFSSTIVQKHQFFSAQPSHRIFMCVPLDPALNVTLRFC